MSEHVRRRLVSISDRASDGTYEDQGIPALEELAGQGAAPRRRGAPSAG